MRLNFMYLLSLLALMCSCQPDYCSNEVDVSDISVDVEIIRLEDKIFSAQSSAELRELFQPHTQYRQRYANLSGTAEDSLFYQEYFRIIQDPYIDTLYQQTKSVFSNIESLETDFEQAFRHIKYYYPNFQPPQIYTTFTGLGSLGSDLLVSDNLIVISLDFFLGDGARFRPQTHDYMLTRYRPEYIVPSSMMILSDKFNNTNREDNSLLAEMIYYGKSYYFMQQVMPCLPDTLIAGYDGVGMNIVTENTKMIWSHFIDNELLYETSHTVIPRYVGERPSVVEINAKVPGRVGRWLGWQIIQNYSQRTDQDLPQVMQKGDARQIFIQAKYRP
ncbi:gliding motility lipoprotein GldB [Tunicatimonas pelagia]|uniref:gliding motility lipoprotein GldB n=1 Tax=Tunicatimonas pelagia TaxID=931531 RepID=UPI00266587EC|nr:gliding motility lipoprotein GldB [Tunicatimonas pelagia]WKN40456.1 gliding motility lipoprotein GldB [Tunicatimonas pelagia]